MCTASQPFPLPINFVLYSAAPLNCYPQIQMVETFPPMVSEADKSKFKILAALAANAELHNYSLTIYSLLLPYFST